MPAPACFRASLRNFSLLLLFAVFQMWLLSSVLNPTQRKDTYRLKRHLAAQLNSIHVDLLTSLSRSRPPDKASLLKLGRLIQQLDPRVRYYELDPAKEKNNNDSGVMEKILDVCPESWKGRIVADGNYPYHPRGFELTNCTMVKPFEKVISILINMATGVKQRKLDAKTVLKGIKDTYPNLRIFVAATRNSLESKIVKKCTGVELVEVPGKNISPGKVWNDLLAFVSTPYVLVGRDLAHFSWLSQIERLVRVISTTPHVGIAGGSFRNSTGHWQIGCYQTELENYVLEYKEGYYYSRDTNCMYCDHVQGPFVSRTELLRKTSFDEKLNREVVFEDIFLRVAEKEHLVMNCPDVMFFTGADHGYTTKPKEKNRQLWRAFATKWTLNRVLLPGGVKHSFSCLDINYKCNPRGSGKLGVALPVCCQEQFASALQFFHNFCEENDLMYELDTGTTMGVVKFRDLLPWDLDGDLIFSYNNYSFFSKRETLDYFKSHGYPLKKFEPSEYFTLNTPDMYVECWGWSATSTQYLPEELQHVPTKARLHGVWLYAPYSPARYVRNRYGHSILKHAQHWITLGMSHSFGEYAAGSFKPCSSPGHHACLDRFHADGNIPFLVS